MNISVQFDVGFSCSYTETVHLPDNGKPTSTTWRSKRELHKLAYATNKSKTLKLNE